VAVGPVDGDSLPRGPSFPQSAPTLSPDLPQSPPPLPLPNPSPLPKPPPPLLLPRLRPRLASSRRSAEWRTRKEEGREGEKRGCGAIRPISIWNGMRPPQQHAETGWQGKVVSRLRLAMLRREWLARKKTQGELLRFSLTTTKLLSPPCPAPSLCP
jgi:hypothetical protein